MIGCSNVLGHNNFVWALQVGRIETNFTELADAVAMARQQRLREYMKKNDLPLMLVLDPVNIKYATGASNMTIFSARTPARYLLLFAEGPAILYEYAGCEHLASGLETIDAVRPARGLCYVSSGGCPEDQATALARDITEAIAQSGLQVDRLAIDRFPFYCVDALRAAGFSITDADSVISAARRNKMPGEISLMREALSRVAYATHEMASKIEPGRRESEIWADFIKPFVATGGQYVTTRLLESGQRTFPYFQEVSDRITQAGDLICFDTDAVGFASYCTDFSRTYLCGEVSATPEQKDLYKKAKDQLDHNIELIAPGVSFREIAEQAWIIPEAHQTSRYYCIGHGLGMSGEFPNIPHAIPGTPYPLNGEIEPHMVLCIESYIGSEKTGQGVKLEEQLLITEQGVECMSASVPFDPRLLSE